MDSFYELSANSLNGKPFDFNALKGQVVLVVNVASKCGFTPQYTGLEKLYRELKGQGLNILGFPCNQFGAQEPGDAQEIQNFCSLTYEVSFPIMEKVDVNGPQTHPVYQFLKNEKKGILGTEAIKWNFTKFLVGRNGEVIRRYPPTAKPEDLLDDIKKAL